MADPSRPSLDDHFAKKSSSASSSSKKPSWDEASGMSLGDLSLNSDIQAMSREAHDLLNQILNDTSDTTTPAKETPTSARRRKGGYDTSYDDELEDELDRVNYVSDDIKALSAELNAVHTNDKGEVVAPVLAESNDNNQLELLESVELSCTPSLNRRAATAGNDDGTRMVRFDPAVEQLKELRVAISNKDIAPPPPRGRAMKKEEPGRLEDGVDQAIMIACIFIWTLIVIIIDHTRTDMMNAEGVLLLPWVFRMFS